MHIVAPVLEADSIDITETNNITIYIHDCQILQKSYDHSIEEKPQSRIESDHSFVNTFIKHCMFHLCIQIYCNIYRFN